MTKDKIEGILKKDKNVLFAYLYGSFLSSHKFNDIDIAVYLKRPSFGDIADLKVKLAGALKPPTGFIDITMLNDILNSPNAFSLLYLERVIKEGKLIVKHNHKIWSGFLEGCSNEYRASVALLDEVKCSGTARVSQGRFRR